MIHRSWRRVAFPSHVPFATAFAKVSLIEIHASRNILLFEFPSFLVSVTADAQTENRFVDAKQPVEPNAAQPVVVEIRSPLT